MKRFIKRNRKKIIKTLAIVTVALIAYQIAHNVATAERGYEAVGGELFVPLLVIFGKDILKLLAEPFKAIKRIVREAK